jgi:methionine synthase I (cobalamin-dependent)/5,10-methylenetetrahydrofolate reductase
MPSLLRSSISAAYFAADATATATTTTPGALTERERFRMRLRRRPLLLDGAMGTLLYSRGIPQRACLDELVLSHPDLISTIHREYLEAGADAIETDTFGGNRFRLAGYGLEKLACQIGRRGAQLAREARDTAGRDALVAGSIGPLGSGVPGRARPHPGIARAAFREQIEALLEGGVDMFVLETFGDVESLLLAVEEVRRACALPIVAQMTFGEDLLANDGATPEAAVEALASAGVDAVGVNCGARPLVCLEALVGMGRPSATLARSIMPNAGLPRRVEGSFVYSAGPEYFGEITPRMLAAGATIIGGCCGTTPEHTRAMRVAIDALSDEERRSIRIERTLEAGRLLQDAGVDLINVSDSATGRVRMGAMAVAFGLQRALDLECLVHLTTRDRNLMALEAELLGAHALGVRNILALTGDPPRIADRPTTTAVWDVDAIGLIEIICGLNRGEDLVGGSIGQPAGFTIACALDPTAANPEREWARLERKLAAGADLIMTQPLYSIAQVEAMLARARRHFGEKGFPVPVLLGVLPLHSARHAEFLHHEVPGITIPDEQRAAMHAAGERGAEAGLEMSMKLLEHVGSEVQGIYVMPSFGRYELAAELVRRLRARDRS